MGPAEHIVCVDCGGQCSLITPQPEDGFMPRDIVAYRCHECLDRWDVELTADDFDAERSHRSSPAE